MQTLRNPTKSVSFGDPTIYNDHYVKLGRSYPQICVYFIANLELMHKQMWTSGTFGLWITQFGELGSELVWQMHEGQMVLYPYTYLYP